MKKMLKTLLISTLFLLTIVNLTTVGKQTEKNNITSDTGIIYVDDDNTEGPWDGTLEHPYQFIQDGINSASDGNIIFVFSGLYNETLAIDRTISLMGEKQNNTIIDGKYGECIINVLADDVSIMKFTLRDSGGYKNNAGVKINSENNTIEKCTFYRTKTGIYANNSNNNKINNCIFHTNGEGVFLKSSSGNSIKDCQFCHNAIGINLENSKENEICYSYLHTNGIGLFFNDSSDIEIFHCAVSDNNDNQGGIFLFGCSNINITNCNIYHNGVGANIANSSSILIEKCDVFWNTHFAIRLGKSSNDVIVSNCEIGNNFRFGINSDSSRCKISSNNIYKNNLDGLYSKSSFCNARYNWWGFFTGPALTEFGIADKVTRELGKVLYSSWYRQPLQNIGSDWDTDDIFTKIEIPDDVHESIKIPGEDTDNDGCPDWWEEKWGYNPNVWNDHRHLDPDQDGLNNIEECFTNQYDSSPFHKDIFLEFDWVAPQNPNSPSNKPPIDLIEKAKAIFEKHDIALHVDDGSLGLGEEIPYASNFSYAYLRDLYWDYFLHNDLNNPRKGIFHYCLVCDNCQGHGYSFVGWDQLDSFEISAQGIQDSFPQYSRGHGIISVAVHELGHTLGLIADRHGGIDNADTTKFFSREWWKYRNYRSCLSYLFTYRILDYSDGSHGRGDFNDWSNLDFTFFKNTHFEWPKN
jgi:parallel beta-helix repeat protein